MKARFAFSAMLFVLPALAIAQSNPAQVTPDNDTGLKPYETYSGTHENVNLATGNLNLPLPLLRPPGRHGLDLDLVLQYDSKIWSPHATYSSSGTDLIYHWLAESSDIGEMGWHFNIPRLNSGDIISDANGYPIGQTAYILTLPDGDKTSFDVPPYSTTFSIDSEDGTFAHIDVWNGGGQGHVEGWSHHQLS